MTSEHFDLNRLLPAARLLVTETTSTRISDEDLLGELDRLMHCGKQLWGCYLDRVITDEELFNALVSRLISFALRHEPRPHPRDQTQFSSATHKALEVAIFGRLVGIEPTPIDEEWTSKGPNER